MLSDAAIEAIARELAKAEGRDPDEKSYPSMFAGDPPEVAWESEARFVRKIALIIEHIEQTKASSLL